MRFALGLSAVLLAVSAAPSLAADPAMSMDSSMGKILVDAHLLRCADPHATQMGIASDDDFCSRIGRGYPRFSGGRVWLNKTTSVPSVQQETWEFRVGTYQVCRKWLKDRCSRPLLRAEIEQYCAIVHAIETTRRTMLDLDKHVARQGDWDTVF